MKSTAPWSNRMLTLMLRFCRDDLDVRSSKAGTGVEDMRAHSCRVRKRKKTFVIVELIMKLSRTCGFLT